MAHCFHAYARQIYRCVFRTCIGTLKILGFSSNTSASYLLPVRQASALLSASFRPLVTKTPLPSRYSLPHVGLERRTFTSSSKKLDSHQCDCRVFLYWLFLRRWRATLRGSSIGFRCSPLIHEMKSCTEQFKTMSLAPIVQAIVGCIWRFARTLTLAIGTLPNVC